MSLQKIKQLVSQLNYKWYKEIKQIFENEQSYVKTKDILEYMNYDEPEKIDLKSYCWAYYSPGHDYYEPDSIIDGSSVSGEILKELDKMIQEIKTDEAKDNIISAVRDNVTDTIEDLQKGHPQDSEYLEVLDYYLLQIRKGIHDEYGEFKHAFTIATNYQDKLKFELKLDELAVLLQILFNEGFIHTSTAKDFTYLTFYKKYFHFKNQRKGNAYSPATEIDKKLSDVRNEEVSHKSLVKVTTELQNAIKQLLK